MEDALGEVESLGACRWNMPRPVALRDPSNGLKTGVRNGDDGNLARVTAR